MGLTDYLDAPSDTDAGLGPVDVSYLSGKEPKAVKPLTDLKTPTGDVSEFRVRAAHALNRDVRPYIAKQLGINEGQVTYDPETANWHILHPTGERKPLFPARTFEWAPSYSEPGLEGVTPPQQVSRNVGFQGALGAAAEVPNVLGVMGGAAAGTAGGAWTGPGAVVTGALGAGAGNFAAESLKQGWGGLVAPGSGERPASFGDFAGGALAEVGGRAIGKAGSAALDRANMFGAGSLLRPLTASEKALRMAASDTTLSPEIRAGLSDVFKGGADAPVFTSPNVRALLNDAAQQSQPARNFIAEQIRLMDPEHRMLFGALGDMPSLITGAKPGYGKAALDAAQKTITDANGAVEGLTRQLGQDQTPVDTQPLLEWINAQQVNGKLPADAQKYLQQAKEMLTQSTDPQILRDTLAKVAPGTGNLTESSSVALDGIQARVKAEAEGIRAEADAYFTPALKGQKIPLNDYEEMLTGFKELRDKTAGSTREAYDKLIRHIEGAVNESGDGSVSLTANGLNQLRATFWSLRKKAPSSAGSDFKEGYDLLKSYLPGQMQEGLDVARAGYGKLDTLDKSTLGRLAGIENPDSFRTALFKLSPDEFARVVNAMPDEGGALVRDYINNAASGMSDTNAKTYAARLYNKLMGSENSRGTMQAALGDDYQHVAGALQGAAEVPKPMTAGQLIADLRNPAAQLATTEKNVLKRDTAKEFVDLLDQHLTTANPALAEHLSALSAAEAKAAEVNVTMGGILSGKIAGSEDITAQVAKIKAAKDLAEHAQPGSWQNVQAHLVDQLTSRQQAEGGALAKKFFGSPDQAARWQAILGPQQYKVARQGILAFDEVAGTLERLSSASTLKPGLAAATEGQQMAGGVLSRMANVVRLGTSPREQQYRAVLREMKQNAPAIVKAFLDPGNAAMVQRMAALGKTDPTKLRLMGQFITYATGSAVLSSTSQQYNDPNSIIVPGGQ